MKDSFSITVRCYKGKTLTAYTFVSSSFYPSFTMCFLGLFFVDSPRKTLKENHKKFMSTYMNGQHTAVPPYTPVFLSYPELFIFLSISNVYCLYS